MASLGKRDRGFLSTSHTSVYCKPKKELGNYQCYVIDAIYQVWSVSQNSEVAGGRGWLVGDCIYGIS